MPPLEPTESSLRAPRQAGVGRVILGSVLILALLAGFIFYQVASLPFRVFDAGTGKLEDWAGKVRGAFVAMTGMQPRVIVNEHVVYEQSNSTLELAVVERELVVERETEDTWMGSTKRLRVRRRFSGQGGVRSAAAFYRGDQRWFSAAGVGAVYRRRAS